jgi:hypothetical protein
MSVTTMEGVVENGQIRIIGGGQLPEHAKVYIVVPDAFSHPQTHYLGSPRLVHQKQALDFIKVVIEENPDAGV